MNEELIGHGFVERPADADAFAEKAFCDPIELDGYLVNPETGEVVGLVDSTFHVTDEKTAEWVMEKMQEEDAAALALTARLQAIQDNLSTLRKRHENRRSYLETKFADELTAFARTQLDGKIKSWTCPYGTVAFRSTPQGLKVSDEELALQFAKEFHPQAVKVTERFLISKLDKVSKDYLAVDEKMRTDYGFEVVPAGETVSIKTGLKTDSPAAIKED